MTDKERLDTTLKELIAGGLGESYIAQIIRDKLPE